MKHAAHKTEITASVSVSSMSIGRCNYILFVLTLAATLNFFDRQILTILMEPIRRELSLSDTQIGFLTGIAFIVAYMSLSIPAALLADSWSRRKVIAIAIGVWSVMTSLCGFAQTFVQLLLARMGVGVGEAGGSAPSQALIGDLFPRGLSSTAMSIFLVSIPIGSGLGLIWGGWAAGQFGWRGAFILAGLPGLIFAPLVYFGIPEIRKRAPAGGRTNLPAASVVQTLRLLMSTPAFRNMIFASSMNAFLSVGISVWLPSLLVRSYHLNYSTVGFKLALVFAVPFGIGVVVGGRLADVAARRDLRWYFWIPTIGSLSGGIFAACALVSPVEYLFWFMALSFLMVSAFGGTGVVITQRLAPVTSRATASALMQFIVQTVGQGIAPQIVGIVSDLLHPTFGEESLRITLLLALTICLPTAYFYYRASRTLGADMAVADARNSA